MTHLLLSLLACDGTYVSGASEPIVVRQGTFHEGELPVDEAATSPTVVYAAGVGYVLTQGQGNIGYSGLASPEAYSVAVTFPSVSTGYWVVPVAGPDVTSNNDLIFKMTVDFKREVPYGLQSLQFVALDGEGNPGPRYESTVCVLPDVANGNFAACDESVTPANAVISLSWDTSVDLDLVAVAPNGKVVSWKSPTTVIADGTIPSEEINAETTGELSRDSNANCEIDNINLESIVFPGEPPAGEYALYASLPAACEASYVNYALALYRRVDAADGTHPVERTELATGTLLAAQAGDGAATLGTYLTTLTLP
jgi:hypothetical protein